MKAHGIAGNNGGARAGSPGPSEPSTPAPRKKLPNARPAGSTNDKYYANKKRKLAARGNDLDDEVKTEVKAEVKQELATSNPTDGSYMIYPNDTLDATASTHVMSGESYKSESTFGDDEILLISGTHGDHSWPVAPMSFVQQMILPPPPNSFYSFVDSSSDLHLPSSTSHPFPNDHDHDADISTQTMMPTDPAMSHWLQHHQNNVSFF